MRGLRGPLSVFIKNIEKSKGVFGRLGVAPMYVCISDDYHRDVDNYFSLFVGFSSACRSFCPPSLQYPFRYHILFREHILLRLLSLNQSSQRANSNHTPCKSIPQTKGTLIKLYTINTKPITLRKSIPQTKGTPPVSPNPSKENTFCCGYPIHSPKWRHPPSLSKPL